MIAIRVSGEAIRRTLRTLGVVAVTVVALGIAVPNLVTATNPFRLGVFGFGTINNVVVWISQDARAAGIAVGDRIDYALMPLDVRYGSPEDGLPRPPMGHTISFVVERHDKIHIARLAPAPSNSLILAAPSWAVNTSQVELTAQLTAFLVVALLSSALVLIRPTPLTAAFFLFVAGNGLGSTLVAMPYHCCSSLGPLGYAVAMVADDLLAGMSAVGFLALAFYLNPKPQTRSRMLTGAAGLLLGVIVLPIAISDVLEITLGARPAWPIAGWASFIALWFCYAGGFVLLLRLTAGAAASRIVRVICAVLAVVGALTILNLLLSAQLTPWYFTNLPSVTMNRNVIYALATIGDLPNAQLAAFHIALRIAAALAVSYAAVRGEIIVARSTFLRIASYAALTVVLVGALLLVGKEQLILRILGSLLAFFVIIRARAADPGPVFARVVAYIIVALLVVTTFAFADVALIQRFPSYPLIFPVEILVAVGIGYWVSGLRDLAGSLSLACVDAFSAWARGHPRDERDALAQALGLAGRTRRQTVIAEVRAQIAFSAWRDGDEGEFERNAQALQHFVAGRRLRGLGVFAEAATSAQRELHFEDDDLPEWKARAALIQCARTDDAVRAQELATEALASADRAALPSLQVLASIAVAETCPDLRSASLETAHAIARDAGWHTLSKSILALRADSRDIGILQSFVDVRLRKSRPGRPMFEISFFNAELRAGNTRVSLPEKQLELLLSVAVTQTGINDNDLLDALWPEAEGDAARNSFRVCLHGLRKNSGDARIVTRIGKAYVVHPWADVDLWRFQSAISECREHHRPECTAALAKLCEALRSGQRHRARVGDWFYRFEQLLTRKLDEAERLLGPASIATRS